MSSKPSPNASSLLPNHKTDSLSDHKKGPAKNAGPSLKLAYLLLTK